jgi:hypothetical protein
VVNRKSDVKRSPSKATDFSRFDQERVAINFKQGDFEFLFKGLAIFQVDDQLGRILRVCGDDPSDGDFILAEKTFEGRIIPDLKYGCRFCFIAASRVE